MYSAVSTQSTWGAAKQKEMGNGDSGSDDSARAVEPPPPPPVSRPAFAGRKEIIVTGNKEEGYTYTEIDASGRVSRAGEADGGFRLDEDSPQLKDARRRIIEKEEQLVEAVAFDQVFVVGGALIAVLLAFMINVGMTGGISDGASRFRDVELPVNGVPPAVPHPSNQVYPDDDLVV
eukprot:TRINITY_DN2926_c0_g1_i3.p1 TRINITY_DN2926_c0_g1~~TRINITY_DN2926_c0_g1_i3.p1  ORF type:complete len:176 (-),score=52.65 TRINITY_DN2926_c0_g1_i3:231-758(-)